MNLPLGWILRNGRGFTTCWLRVPARIQSFCFQLIVSDVSNLCNRFAVIRGGQILAETSPDTALAGLEGRIWEATLPREGVAGLKASGKVISQQMAGGRTRVRILSENGKPAEPFVAVTATLEDHYFIVVNQV